MDWLTPKEMAAREGVCERTIRRRISRGIVEASRIGGLKVRSAASTVPASTLLTKQQAADLLGVSERKVHDLIADGSLPTVRIGRCVRIHPDALEAYVKSRTTHRTSK